MSKFSLWSLYLMHLQVIHMAVYRIVTVIKIVNHRGKENGSIYVDQEDFRSGYLINNLSLYWQNKKLIGHWEILSKFMNIIKTRLRAAYTPSIMIGEKLTTELRCNENENPHKPICDLNMCKQIDISYNWHDIGHILALCYFQIRKLILHNKLGFFNIFFIFIILFYWKNFSLLVSIKVTHNTIPVPRVINWAPCFVTRLWYGCGKVEYVLE